jgi:hypothetical protein
MSVGSQFPYIPMEINRITIYRNIICLVSYIFHPRMLHFIRLSELLSPRGLITEPAYQFNLLAKHRLLTPLLLVRTRNSYLTSPGFRREKSSLFSERQVTCTCRHFFTPSFACCSFSRSSMSGQGKVVSTLSLAK